jgi:hypothetical protein
MEHCSLTMSHAVKVLRPGSIDSTQAADQDSRVEGEAR